MWLDPFEKRRTIIYKAYLPLIVDTSSSGGGEGAGEGGGGEIEVRVGVGIFIDFIIGVDTFFLLFPGMTKQEASYIRCVIDRPEE